MEMTDKKSNTELAEDSTELKQYLPDTKSEILKVHKLEVDFNVGEACTCWINN
jgi:hypothetical protein